MIYSNSSFTSKYEASKPNLLDKLLPSNLSSEESSVISNERINNFLKEFESKPEDKENNLLSVEICSNIATVGSYKLEDEKANRKHIEHITNFSALMIELKSLSTSVIKARCKEEGIKMGDYIIDRFFHYTVLKMILSKIITGIIPNMIIQNGIISNFMKLTDCSIDSNKIDDSKKNTTEYKEINQISSENLIIKNFDLEFEKLNCKMLADISLITIKHVLSHLIKTNRKFSSADDFKGFIRDNLRYYKLRVKTPECHANMVKAYRYLPYRIINIMEEEEAIEIKKYSKCDSQKWSSKDDHAQLYNNSRCAICKTVELDDEVIKILREEID